MQAVLHRHMEAERSGLVLTGSISLLLVMTQLESSVPSVGRQVEVRSSSFTFSEAAFASWLLHHLPVKPAELFLELVLVMDRCVWRGVVSPVSHVTEFRHA